MSHQTNERGIMAEENQDQTQQAAPPAPPAPPKKKSNKALWIILGVIGGLFACVIIVVGAGLFMAKKAVDKGVESIEHEGKKLGIEKTGDGSYKVKTKDTTTETGDDVELPKDWPADVAVYEGKLTSASTISGGKSFYITVTTSDEKAAIEDYYKTNLEKEGWKSSSTGNYSGVTTLSYQKDNYKRSATVTIGKDYTDDSKRSISVTVTKS